MKITLHVRSGALIGRSFQFSRGPVRVGRRPDLELSLNPEEDLAASGLHAEFYETSDGWMVQDLDSRNGTWVNGRRIREPTPVQSGMRIAFGTGGPVVEAVVGERPGPGTVTRIRVAVQQETRRLRGWMVVLALALVGVTATLLIRGHLKEAVWEEERREILAAADRALGETEGSFLRPQEQRPEAGEEPIEDPFPALELQELEGALENARAEVRALRDALHEAESARSEPSPAEQDLRHRLQEATAALSRRQLAGSLDFRGIQDANARAVALVYVQTEGGEVSTGTAFAVRPDGLLLTVRHLLLPDPDGPMPARIGVQFANSSQIFPGRLVASSEEHDLAAIRADNISGDVPVVKGFNLRPDTLGTGAPVASLGFPLGGGATAPDGEPGAERVVRPLLTAGVLSRVAPEGLEFHGYGDAGASGSPIFDGDGEVVGVLYGGRAADAEQVLFAVSALQASRFLQQVP